MINRSNNTQLSADNHPKPIAAIGAGIGYRKIESVSLVMPEIEGVFFIIIHQPYMKIIGYGAYCGQI